MNQSSPLDSQSQSSDSVTHQPSPLSTPYNPQDGASSHESSTALNGDVCVTNGATQSQLLQQPPVINTPVQMNHPNVFFFRPPKDFYHYHVICKEISYDEIERLLNKPSFNINEN